MQQVSCDNPLWALPIFMYVTSLSYYWLHLSNISCINLKRYCMLGSWHTLTRWDWTVITKNMRSIAAPVAVIWARQKLSHWLWQPIRTLSILGGHVASAIVFFVVDGPLGYHCVNLWSPSFGLECHSPQREVFLRLLHCRQCFIMNSFQPM